MNKTAMKYLAKYKERNYAPQVRKLEKSDLRKYSDRDACRQTPEASHSNCDEQSWQEEQEEISKIPKKKGKSMKNDSQKKKVLKHLKEDIHEFKEQIKDDKKLTKSLNKSKKK